MNRSVLAMELEEGGAQGWVGSSWLAQRVTDPRSGRSREEDPTAIP